MRHIFVILAAIALALPLCGAPIVTLQNSTVEISNIAPGASVALLGVVHEPQAYHLRVRTVEAGLTDDDRDGIVRYDVASGSANTSVWIAAEVSSGEVGIVSPHGVVPIKSVPAAALHSPKALSIPGDLIEILYVRPGTGAWRTTITDSGAKDADHKPDGFATIDLAQLQPIGSSLSSPEHYRGGDIAVAIDVIPMNVYRFQGGK